MFHLGSLKGDEKLSHTMLSIQRNTAAVSLWKFKGGCHTIPDGDQIPHLKYDKTCVIRGLSKDFQVPQPKIGAKTQLKQK